MSKVVIISGHPNLPTSHTNTLILEQLSLQLADIEVRRLDELYPDYRVDIQAEQEALIKADIVVLQFPFYWYSVPALMKKWIDDVFSYDFAYGVKGDKLKGKDLILSFTVGGPEESYDPQGYNHFEIEQMIRPLQQTAYLAGMNYTKPVYSHKMVYIPDVYNELSEVQDRAKQHADRLVLKINDLVNSTENKVSKFVQKWFAQFDLLPEQSEFFTEQLSTNIRLVMPEGEFIGHEGFRDWYQVATATFKPNCQHLVEQTTVTEGSNGAITVELRVRLIAETYEDSALNGESINLLVNETWQMSVVEDNRMVINEYFVELVQN